MPDDGSAPSVPLWSSDLPIWVNALGWLAVGALLLGGIALLAGKLTPWRPQREVRWTLIDVLVVLLSFLVSLTLLVQVAFGALHPDEPDPRLPIVWSSAVQVGAQLVALSLVFFLAAKSHPASSWEKLGFGGGGQLRSFALGAVAFLAAFPFVQGLFLIHGEVWSLFSGGALPTQETLERVRAVDTTAGRVFVQGVAGFFAPVAEEIVWRAWIQPVFVRALGPWRGIAVTSLFFVVLGHGPEVWLPLFGFSLVLGWLYQRTARIAAPIALHLSLNLSTLFFLPLFTD